MERSSDQREKRLLLWGIESAGEGLLATISNTYLAIFMTDVAMIPLGLTSAVMLIMSVSDWIFAMFAGAVISMVPPGRWGRLRSYLLCCPAFVAVFYTLHFLSVPNAPVLSAIIITAGFILAKIPYNLIYVANVSLINVIAKDQAAKNRLSSQRMIFSNLGRMGANSLVPILVLLLAGRLGERIVYPIIMAGGGLLYVLTNLIHFVLSKGYENSSSSVSAEDEDAGSLSFGAVLEILFTHSRVLVTVVIDLTSNVASLVLPPLAAYYYKYVAEAPNLVPIHMALTGAAAIGGSLFVRAFGSHVKRPRKALLAIYPTIALFLFLTRFGNENVSLFLACNILVHGLTGTTQSFELSLYMDDVAYVQKRTGKDANALIMGISGVTVKIANIIKSVTVPLSLSIAGYVPGVVTEAVKSSIINAYSIVPALIPLLGFLLLYFRPDDEK
ncbi:MAG: hypothetical protein HFF07_01640 [Oscillospiraceae bacterium]|nr:hypothetical protein [Oscillospiraceae bacterium]